MSEKMNVYEGERYLVIEPNNNGWLNISPLQAESVEGCREAIDHCNACAAKYGKKPEQWMIVRKVWNRVSDPYGRFVESHETVSRVEIYPREI